jgi:hypothetical protein
MIWTPTHMVASSRGMRLTSLAGKVEGRRWILIRALIKAIIYFAGLDVRDKIKLIAYHIRMNL